MPIASHVAHTFLGEHDEVGEVSFSDEARALLEAYDWPRNVRELRAAVEHAVIHAGHRQQLIVIRPIHLPERLRSFPEQVEHSARLTRGLVERVLDETGGNQSEAARRLGVHRNTIARYRKSS